MLHMFGRLFNGHRQLRARGDLHGGGCDQCQSVCLTRLTTNRPALLFGIFIVKNALGRETRLRVIRHRELEFDALLPALRRGERRGDPRDDEVAARVTGAFARQLGIGQRFEAQGMQPGRL